MSIERDMDLSRNDALDKYDVLTEDLKNDKWENNISDALEVREFDRDDTFKSLYNEMDRETRNSFINADKDAQKEVLEEIRAGRMSLAEARQVLDRRRK